MQTTLRKTETKVKSKEKTSKDDATPLPKKTQDEKLKRSVYSVSTPRNYVLKSTTADIYAQKKKSIAQATKAPKKVPGLTNKSSNVSPMKDQLRSSASSVSQISQASAKTVKSSPLKKDAKLTSLAKTSTPRTGKDLPFLNVTVNSPVAKRKTENKDPRNSNTEKTAKIQNGGIGVDSARKGTKDQKSSSTKEVKKRSSDLKEVSERQRTKTRTLNDNEVKILTPDAVDNNAEMMNLSKRLVAQPKAFYVDLDESTKNKEKVSRYYFFSLKPSFPVPEMDIRRA